MRKVSILAAAFVVATGAFWALMLVKPPQTEAAQPRPSININDLMIHSGLPLAEPSDAF